MYSIKDCIHIKGNRVQILAQVQTIDSGTDNDSSADDRGLHSSQIRQMNNCDSCDDDSGHSSQGRTNTDHDIRC